MARTSEPPIRCSFCGKRESQAGRLIAGPGVYICSDCVKACSDLLAEEMAAKKSGIPKLDSLLRNIRDRRIRQEYDGTNTRTLALKYDVSESWVKRIASIDERGEIRGQTSLFDG